MDRTAGLEETILSQERNKAQSDTCDRSALRRVATEGVQGGDSRDGDRDAV